MKADKQKRVHIMFERQNYFGVQREDCLTLVRGRDQKGIKELLGLFLDVGAGYVHLGIIH